MLTCRIWTAQRRLAFAPVEAGERAAGERGPDDAVARDIEPAGREALHGGFRIVPWQFVDFSKSGLRGIRSGRDPHDRTGETQDRSPYGAVCRINCDAIEGS